MSPTPRLFARRIRTSAWLASVLAIACCPCVFAAEKAIDLSGEKAADDWLLLDKTASIQDGQLVLDGRREAARAFYGPSEWTDCSLRAKFMVEPRDEGVLACGFVVRAADASTYYYVHFDRARRSSCARAATTPGTRSSGSAGWTSRPASGTTASLPAQGDTLRVSLNGKLLFEAKDASIGRGRIGFYAGQGLAHVKDIVVSGEPAAATAEFNPAADVRPRLPGRRGRRLRGVSRRLPPQRRPA